MKIWMRSSVTRWNITQTEISVRLSLTDNLGQYQISSQSSKFLHFSQPYWIRHFEFQNFKLGFGIGDHKNPRNPAFTIIKKSDYMVNDFVVLILKEIILPKNICIRNVKRIVYHMNSYVDVFYDNESKPIEFMTESKI